MGTRYTLNLNCVYCGILNNDIWYAPTSNCYTFCCTKCEKDNFIDENLKVKKIEKISIQDIKKGFLATTSLDWDSGELDQICKETFIGLTKGFESFKNGKWVKDGKKTKES